jgi:hypothetical protein
MDSTKQHGAATQQSKAERKPYQKPTFRHERVFETMALACGKLQSTEHGCRFNRKNS